MMWQIQLWAKCAARIQRAAMENDPTSPVAQLKRIAGMLGNGRAW